MYAEKLYILGDLFDIWIGDDDPARCLQRIVASLRQLKACGVPIYFQCGNRDFLIGKDFLREHGVEWLEDYAVIDLYGVPTLLMHGDLLCTDDRAYQHFRAQSRTVEWRQRALRKPLWLRLSYARWYRLRSYWHKRQVDGAIMDVNPLSVAQTFREHEVKRLIHGHTHRPGVYPVADMPQARRFVLAEWRQGATMLWWNAEGYRYESITD